MNQNITLKLGKENLKTKTTSKHKTHFWSTEVRCSRNAYSVISLVALSSVAKYLLVLTCLQTSLSRTSREAMLINSHTTSTSSHEVKKKKLRLRYRSKIQRLRSDREIGKLLIIIGNTELLSLVSFASFPCMKAQLEVTTPEHSADNIWRKKKNLFSSC